MIRLALTALSGAVLAIALSGPSTLAAVSPEPPRSLDKQEGNDVTIRGILSVQKKGTTKEVFFVDGYKLRGLPREKFVPFIGKRVVVDGEFRVIFGELIVYARSIDKAPEPGQEDDS